MARIGVDLDGVLYDFAASLKHYLTCWHQFDPRQLTPPTRWEFYLDWGLSEDQFKRLCCAGVNEEVIFLHGSPLDNAAIELGRLKDAGHTIHIITDRAWGTNNRAQSNTYAWLAKHDIPWDSVTFAANKGAVAFELDLDYMIDDKPQNYIDIHNGSRAKVSLRTRPWNDKYAGYWRVDSLKQFVDSVIRAETPDSLDEPIPYTLTEQPVEELPDWEQALLRPAPGAWQDTPSETRTTSSTGGEKGVKPAQFNLLPAHPLFVIAEHFAKGAEKYDAHNWRRGYEWSKSFGALQRHLWAWWGGEDVDAETGSSHLAAAGFHVLALLQFVQDFPEFDDRFKPDDPDDDPTSGAFSRDEVSAIKARFLAAVRTAA